MNSHYCILTEEYRNFASSWQNPEITTIEAQTSGSTGAPKKILLPKDRMKQSAKRTIAYFGIDPHWLLGSCISAKYIGGKMMMVRAFEAGCPLICIPPSNRPDLTTFLSSDRPSLISIVPSQMWHILEYPLTEREKKNIKFLIGGSAIPESLRTKIVEKGLEAWESYGMTETCSHIALRKVADNDLPFTPLPGIEIAQSEDNTLIIKNASEAPLTTNDLAEIDAEGNFRILGRLDNVIISGGLKVLPEQLESKLKAIFATSPFSTQFSDLMISSRPHPKWGQVPILLLELPDTPSNITITGNLTEEIDAYLKKYKNTIILPHEYPAEIVLLSSLPRTPNGKLQRRFN